MLVELTYPNGYQCTYDDAIDIGSVITAYHSGYFRVTDVTVRPGQSPYFTYKQLAKADGTPVKGKAEKGCDAAYCALVSREFISELHDAQLKAADQLYDALMGFIE